MRLDLGVLVERTCLQLRAQKEVPLSPGRHDEHKTMLCAGAALVKEAMSMLRSEADAVQFEREVVTRDSDYIREVGSELGLDLAVVDGAIIMNDNLCPSTRLFGTLEYLSKSVPDLSCIKRA